MRNLFLSLFFYSFLCQVSGQQLHFTSQYMQHNPMYNPGAAGISNRNMAGASYRSMWSSFPGNPRTYMVYGDAELRNVNSGIGAYLYRDETGPSRRTGVQLAYSYHITPRSEKYKIGLGLELRGIQYAIDKTKLIDALGNDPVLSGAENKFSIDAGAGIYYTNYKLSLGASVSQLMGSRLELANVPGVTRGGKLYRHYNIIANYKWNAGDDIYVIPNALIRLIENSPSEYDFGLMINYRELLWWGLNWRVRQSWSIQAGLRIMQRVALTYSYDYYTSPLNLFYEGTGAHELGIQFSINKKQTAN